MHAKQCRSPNRDRKGAACFPNRDREGAARYPNRDREGAASGTVQNGEVMRSDQTLSSTNRGARARLAWDTIAMKPCDGIPAWMLHVMDIPFMEEMTGHRPGDYARNPDEVYIAFQELAGVCFIDQYLADNPLTMEAGGFHSGTERKATTGASDVVMDGIRIDSAEAVLEHLERVVFPRRQAEIDSWDEHESQRLARMIDRENTVQRMLGDNILKGPYADGFQSFPILQYQTYGYEHYFIAYALCPEVMARDFAQQADLAVLQNRLAVRAIQEGNLPGLMRLDFDMADSRSTLVDIKSLDRIWFPQLARAIQPFLDAGIRLIWHCDGNLMAMVTRLIEAGIGGFQGFQYEDGMDYERICRMTDRDGGPLFIIAGASVTRTLPFGTKADVVDELKWLVENGPRTGLMLGASSSIVPGTNRENIKTLMAGLHYYQHYRRL